MEPKEPGEELSPEQKLQAALDSLPRLGEMKWTIDTDQLVHPIEPLS